MWTILLFLTSIPFGNFYLLLFITSNSAIAVGPAKRFYTEVVTNLSAYDRNFPPWDGGGKVNVHIFCYQIVLLYVVENNQNVGFTTEINTVSFYFSAKYGNFECTQQ